VSAAECRVLGAALLALGLLPVAAYIVLGRRSGVLRLAPREDRLATGLLLAMIVLASGLVAGVAAIWSLAVAAALGLTGWAVAGLARR
jgi:hypothetical protein